ncbi:MAG: fasciclin domain-containing protein [Pedobacter sp.]|uniref:fasciclin domain-containing protein n=1 Tax=Pedobacter sp. TaxID=1411316 RepID=UPI00280961EF|nr:fasciclin domain-containing protein [Pedobacter sp.]MDQ8006689.1 fasciclin domain-containing protein [Pedobacter sp.]
MEKKIKTLTIGVVVFSLLAVFTSCKKNSEYYNYETTANEFKGTALQYLQAQTNTFDSLLLVLDRLPDLKDSLNNQNVTVFAPTNTSFQAAIKNLNIERKAQGKSPLYLSDCNVEQLDTLTTRYILRGIKNTSDYSSYTEGLLLSSLKSGYVMHVQYNKINASGFVEGGPQSIIYSDPKNNIFTKYWQRSNTNAVNIKAKNAVINILAPLHDFGFDEFIKRVNL